MTGTKPQSTKRHFDHSDMVLEERTTVYDGFVKVDEIQIRHRLFGGGWSKSLRRELVVKKQAAVLLPYDPVADQLVLTEEFRIGALDDIESPWMMELVAGTVDDGESFERTALREAREEAGLHVTDLLPIARYLSSAGACNEEIQIYCGRIDAQNVGGIHGLDSESEDIRVHKMDVSVAFAMLAEGQIRNAATILALQWLQLHRDSVREQWA
ncbi:MAG: NUDIX domain-containing protein [Pseudomonadales bacterium]|nr:NUDIX domain-containing protein [Pseudomonadales bacterium]